MGVSQADARTILREVDICMGVSQGVTYSWDPSGLAW